MINYISKDRKIICQTGKYQNSIKRNLFSMFSLLSRSRTRTSSQTKRNNFVNVFLGKGNCSLKQF